MLRGNEHRVEVVIALIAPKAWNPNSVKIVHNILTGKMQEAVMAAHHLANEWTERGEPVRVEFEMRTVTK